MARGSQELAAAGIPAAPREARRLFTLAAGSPAELAGSAVPPAVGRRYRMLVAARARRVPFPLLEGETGFLDFDVAVRPGVFIPRPETEELAERAIAVLRSLPPHPRALDLGTGTGALAVALARARDDGQVLAVDMSPRALACARRNVRAHRLESQVEIRRSDWFSCVREAFHLIVANPPYVARCEFSSLEPEVRLYEPRRALDGGPDGLDALRAILVRTPHHLLPGGTILVEIGARQGAAALAIARRVPGLGEARVERDQSGKERFLIARCA
ncbi:MAG TPA: peptide chain release factor N(5)-glutamine methyltransferase [Candidatus Bipolaricaulis sp.]|nr:peptide chain release factor N(5)-glutamine methyltransferase [Candidatus Bipolaricaulis sp.]HRS13760.1 peptide chain release factor N(5)-glutamine methyltransferase [Candidatus Bipolaricaulis sp.]HRU21532.1 peptide chain release factor N(5)-glutamine methyltransferase [Candidatus Bipolaricaulis sp.]